MCESRILSKELNEIKALSLYNKDVESFGTYKTSQPERG